MPEPTVEELERVFERHVGVSRLEFYRLLESDARRLLRVVEGEGSLSLEQRALASRALAYLVQGKDAVPDEQLLGHVDDYIVLLVARDELFPDETSELSAEALMECLSQEERERVARSVDLVLDSKDSFPGAVLKPGIDQVLNVIRKRRDEPRDVLTLMTTVLPGLLEEMACAVVKEALDPEEGKRR